MKIIYPIILLALITIFVMKDKITPFLFNTGNISKQSSVNTPQDNQNKVEVIVRNLNIPWEMVFLPNGDFLVTERSGKLLKIGSETKVINEIEGVAHIGEGGLLGLTLHPNFESNNYIYLYSTTQTVNSITNRVERYKLLEDELSERTTILEGIRGASNHDGGRIAFGPDGYLYITTGDAQNPNLSQDINSLNGKILRINDNGSVPSNNPFGNAVYSLGHRNPQGLIWDEKGTLWATEHGPSGIDTGYDEVNTIEKGLNYGWPIVKGNETGKNFISPVIQSGSTDTWAPSGITYWQNSLFFAGLRGEALYEAKIDSNNNLDLLTHFKGEFGRIRTIVLGNDGFLYLLTNNTDGRGTKKEGDDKIVRIDPEIFR